MIDSHCHLDYINLSEHSHNMDIFLKYLQNKGIEYILSACVNPAKIGNIVSIAKKYKGFVGCTLGAHPTEFLKKEPTIKDLVDLGSKEEIIGIGETGLDYYCLKRSPDQQKQRFIEHISAAKLLKKPLIVHSRDAEDDTIKIMKSEGAEDVGGIMHCFTESWKMAKSALDMGFYISFSGIITYKNAHEIRRVAKRVPIDRILIETDSPYLSPVPVRGKQNTPFNIRYIIKYLANEVGLEKEVLIGRLRKNFFRLFENIK